MSVLSWLQIMHFFDITSLMASFNKLSQWKTAALETPFRCARVCVQKFQPCGLFNTSSKKKKKREGMNSLSQVTIIFIYILFYFIF